MSNEGAVIESTVEYTEESRELVVVEDGSAKFPAIVSLQGLGTIIAASGFFKDSRQASKAVVKVLAGQELGFAPIFSMSNIFVIDGKISLGATLMAAKIRNSARYDYRILEHTDNGCTVGIYRHPIGDIYDTSEEAILVGEASFDKKDAHQAGLLGKSNWKKYKRDMYLSRAISRAAKWYCPEIFGGAAYTPDELGAILTDDGSVIIEGEVEDITERATPALNLKGSAATVAEPTLSIVGDIDPETEWKDTRPDWLKAKMLEADAGMTVKEIAERMKVPQALVKSWLAST